MADARPKSGYPRLSVLVPAYNEEDGIASVIADLQLHLTDFEIIVIDDCSTDKTAERASAFEGVRVIRLPYNHGYGAALRRGIEAATGDTIAWFDADGEHRAEDLAAMVLRLHDERLGAVLGARQASVSGSRLAGKLLIRLFAVLLGLGYVRDFNCGLRLFQRDIIERFLLLLPEGYSASTTSTFLTIRLHIPFRFHPITLRPRIGESKVRLADGFKTLVTVLRIASLLQPLRLFGAIASGLAFAGLVYSAVVMIVNGQGLPVLGGVMIISAFLIYALAVLADQLSLLRLQHSMDVGLTKLRSRDAHD
ncbi:glycosyltransferase family 2 protein [Devosia sp. CAU 1758]